jgi:hypothetical protein
MFERSATCPHCARCYDGIWVREASPSRSPPRRRSSVIAAFAPGQRRSRRPSMPWSAGELLGVYLSVVEPVYFSVRAQWTDGFPRSARPPSAGALGGASWTELAARVLMAPLAASPTREWALPLPPQPAPLYADATLLGLDDAPTVGIDAVLPRIGLAGRWTMWECQRGSLMSKAPPLRLSGLGDCHRLFGVFQAHTDELEGLGWGPISTNGHERRVGHSLAVAGTANGCPRAATSSRHTSNTHE